MGGEAHAPPGDAGVGFLLAGGKPDTRIILGWKLSDRGRRQQRHERQHPPESGTNRSSNTRLAYWRRLRVPHLTSPPAA